MRTKLPAIRIFLIIALSFWLIGSGTALAGAKASHPTIGGSCTPSSASFYGFPTWYAYLPSKYQLSSRGLTCSPTIKSISDVWLIVAAAIEILLRLAGIAAVFMILYGGVRYTTSMGNPEETASARRTIIYSLIGLLIAISAAFLITFVATTFGASG